MYMEAQGEPVEKHRVEALVCVLKNTQSGVT